MSRLLFTLLRKAGGDVYHVVLAIGQSNMAGRGVYSAGLEPDLHIAFTDGAAAVIWVTDETTDQPITAGNVINFPLANITCTSNQPT